MKIEHYNILEALAPLAPEFQKQFTLYTDPTRINVKLYNTTESALTTKIIKFALIQNNISFEQVDDLSRLETNFYIYEN